MDFWAWRMLESLLRPQAGRLAVMPPRPMSLPAPAALPPAAKLPKISVVVPSYNQGRFLEATLLSLLEQHYPALELIVVDGGSTDDSVDILRRHAHRLTWWVSEPDAGQSAAINKGFAHSSGEIMAWLNSDDLCAPGALARVAGHFLKHPQTQAVYGDRVVIDAAGLEIGRWILPRHSRRVLRWADFVPQESLFWRREAWEKAGGKLDESLRFAMDWDFLLRLAACGLKIQHYSGILGIFRVHAEQKTSSQMSTVGQQEIDDIHLRELGFLPTRRQLILHTLPYLLAARCRELGTALALRPGVA